MSKYLPYFYVTRDIKMCYVTFYIIISQSCVTISHFLTHFCGIVTHFYFRCFDEFSCRNIFPVYIYNTQLELYVIFLAV